MFVRKLLLTTFFIIIALVPAASPALMQDQTTITIWGYYPQLPIIDKLNGLIPGVTFEYEFITTDYMTRLATAFAAGQPPDMAMLPGAFTISYFASQGTLLTLQDAVGSNVENYPSDWISLGTDNGNLFALPLGMNLTSLVWYNRSLLDQAACGVPETYDAFVGCLNGLKGVVQYPLVITNQGWGVTNLVSDLLLRSAGFDEAMNLASLGADWTSPQVQGAMQEASTLLSQYSAPLGQFGDSNQAFDAMVKGNVGMVIAPDAIGYGYSNPDYSFDKDYGFFVLPSNDGGPIPIQGNATYIAGSSASSHADIIAQAMAYLSSQQGIRDWASSGFNLSPGLIGDTSIYPSVIQAQEAEQYFQTWQRLGGAPSIIPLLSSLIDPDSAALIQGEMEKMANGQSPQDTGNAIQSSLPANCKRVCTRWIGTTCVSWTTMCS